MKSAEYTYEMFITGVSMADIPQAIYRGTVFGRGLPQGHVLRETPDITAIMNEVIRKESIVCADNYLASDPKNDDTRQAALRKIFRSGCCIQKSERISMEYCTRLHPRSIGGVLTGSLMDRHWSPGSSSRTCSNLP